MNYVSKEFKLHDLKGKTLESKCEKHIYSNFGLNFKFGDEFKAFISLFREIRNIIAHSNGDVSLWFSTKVSKGEVFGNKLEKAGYGCFVEEDRINITVKYLEHSISLVRYILNALIKSIGTNRRILI